MAEKDMTEEEAQYWSDYFMKNPPKTDPSKPGIFAQRAEIIGEMVRERIAASV